MTEEAQEGRDAYVDQAQARLRQVPEAPVAVDEGMASALPTVDELLDGSVGFAVPLTTRFRGTRVRQGLLLQGPFGWAEFAPFPEYDA